MSTLKNFWRRLCELLRDQRDVPFTKEQAYARLFELSEQ